MPALMDLLSGETVLGSMLAQFEMAVASWSRSVAL